MIFELDSEARRVQVTPLAFVHEYEPYGLHDSVGEGRLVRGVSAEQDHLLEWATNIQVEGVPLSLQLGQSFRERHRTRSAVGPALDAVKYAGHVYLSVLRAEL